MVGLLKMKPILSFCFFLLTLLAKAQSVNLVPNSGFEDSLQCQQNLGTCRPDNWFVPTDGTPDYFLISSPGNWGCLDDGTPSGWGGGRYSNQWGYQLPHSGEKYVGFGVPGSDEFIEVELTDSLKINKKYAVSFYVSLANSSYCGIDLIEFALTNDNLSAYFIYTGASWFNDSTGTGGNSLGNIIIDTLNWVLITDTITANGGERFLTVGNFDTSNTYTNYIFLDTTTTTPYAYYYFDDFDIHCIDCSTSIPPISDYLEITLTPNPGNGNFYLNGNFPPETKMKIYNMLGQIIWSENIESGNRTVPVFLQLAAGVYVYQVQSGNDVLKNGKLVIEK